MHKNSIIKPTKMLKKKEGEEGALRKAYMDEVNLIKVHYKQAINIKMKPLCTIHLC
jgi:hypothetical protein